MEFKALLRSLLTSNPGWRLASATLGPVASLYRRIEAARQRAAHDRQMTAYQSLFKDAVVLNGPFRGLKYPQLRSIGSQLYPKLLGSYESEIADVIEELCREDYSAVVDIGCAEGYYAVGLAMRLPRARVYAFDTNDDALALCGDMARLNNVTVHRGGFCDAQTLRSLDLGKRALIVSDCEGYEVDLFTKSLIAEFAQHDFLIESHDFIDLHATQSLKAASAETHQLTEYESVDDLIKAYRYQAPQLDQLSLQDRRVLLSEHRPRTMRWLLLRSKQQTASRTWRASA